jgi:hypothetical protein
MVRERKLRCGKRRAEQGGYFLPRKRMREVKARRLQPLKVRLTSGCEGSGIDFAGAQWLGSGGRWLRRVRPGTKAGLRKLFLPDPSSTNSPCLDMRSLNRASWSTNVDLSRAALGRNTKGAFWCSMAGIPRASQMQLPYTRPACRLELERPWAQQKMERLARVLHSPARRKPGAEPVAQAPPLLCAPGHDARRFAEWRTGSQTFKSLPDDVDSYPKF